MSTLKGLLESMLSMPRIAAVKWVAAKDEEEDEEKEEKGSGDWEEISPR